MWHRWRGSLHVLGRQMLVDCFATSMTLTWIIEVGHISLNFLFTILWLVLRRLEVAAVVICVYFGLTVISDMLIVLWKSTSVRSRS